MEWEIEKVGGGTRRMDRRTDGWMDAKRKDGEQTARRRQSRVLRERERVNGRYGFGWWAHSRRHGNANAIAIAIAIAIWVVFRFCPIAGIRAAAAAAAAAK